MTKTSNTHNSDDSDANKKGLKSRKEKVVQQPGSSLFSDDSKVPGANKDLLEELREKTADLAIKIGGKEPQKNKVLELDDKPIKLDDIDAEISSAKEKINEHPIRSLKDDDSDKPIDNPAVSLIREKLSRIYKEEPDAEEEAAEAYNAGKNRSIHQQFMYDLTTSGKSLADIQTDWHNYYVALPEDQKHEVWQEFYTNNQHHSSRYTAARADKNSAKPTKTPLPQPKEQPKKVTRKAETKSVGELKSKLHNKISADGRLKPVHHFKSLLFGLGLAGLVGLIITFTFFNQVFIAPFVSPSQTVSATPIIGSSTGEVGPEPKIIIPKINLEVPVVFDMNSVQEEDIQNALEDGVVHYATSPNPGEIGNSVIVGHSSNNILNSGKYKFAFVLLKRLEVEDTFFVQRDGVRYTYKIYKKDVVGPDEVSVLGQQDRANTMTLITCDPPGTSINRLIVTAEQISPDPVGNTASTAPDIPIEEAELPSNAPSLWSRLWPF